MATDGPTPAPCDKDVFSHGRCVFLTHSIPSNAMERWVKKVAAKSGQRVDWSFMAGRAIVKALGDLALVHAALVELKPEHDSLWNEAVGDDRFSPPPGFEEGLTESSGYVDVMDEA